MADQSSADLKVPAPLGLWDTVSIIVGIIIGAGIYKAPDGVFAYVSAPWQVAMVWLLGGILSLLGALCFAELASTYPRSGGEYVYLTRAYGPGVGFLFAWAQLAIIRPGGGIAIPAYVLAEAAANLGDLGRASSTAVAAVAIALLTFINLLGAKPGKRTQNLFTLAKIASLAGIVVAGFALSRAPTSEGLRPRTEAGSFIGMMIVVLYAYDGWNEAAYVSSEVRERRRNLPRALLIGTSAVTVIYLLVNLAYVAGFGFETARTHQVGAEGILRETLGPTAGGVMSVLVIISVLGALTGMIFTGSRIFSELGTDHRLFAPLGWWSVRFGTPVCSLLVQCFISIGMIVGAAVWFPGKDGFDALLRCTAPVFWLFFLLTGAALLVLRHRDPDAERPFRVPLYPLVPLLFCGWSGFMLFASLRDLPSEAIVGVAVLLAGLPLYLISRSLAKASEPSPKPAETLVRSPEIALPQASQLPQP
jgi:amino acid transporter